MCKAKELQTLYQKTKAYHGDTHDETHCLYHVHRDDCNTNGWICADAARKGHYACLAYAHQVGCPMTSHTITYGALKGNMECIEYACKHGVVVESLACANAALKGHLECLKYLHAHLQNIQHPSFAYNTFAYNTFVSEKMNEQIVEYAAYNGHLPCIIFLRENGYPLTEKACENALFNGHFECFVYLYQHVRPGFELFEILNTTMYEILIGTSRKDLFENSTLLCVAYILREHAHGRIKNKKDTARVHILSSDRKKEALAHAMAHRKRVAVIENAYIMYKVKKRVNIYKRELMQVAWHPLTFFDWCLDIDEQKEIKARWANVKPQGAIGIL